MRKIRVGDVAVAPLPGGGFGACQVSGVLPGTVALHALDWHGPRPPGLDELRGIGPAVVKRHRVRAEVARTSVSREHNPMPPDFEWIGNLPVPAGVPDTVDTWSGWRTPLLDTVLEREWAALPEEVRAARRRSRAADPVTVDLGAGPVIVSAGLDELDLSAWPADRPMDPALLPLLPRCDRISWTGPDRGLVAALRRHPLVTRLSWSDAPGVVDLHGTRVRHPEVSGKDLREIRLPAGAHSLQIDGADAVRTVLADDDGRWLRLHIVAAAPHSVAPSGLGRVRSVSLRGPGVLSAATVAGFTEAHTLLLFWESSPGRLDEPAALAGMTGLRLLEMVDAYGLDVGALPDLSLRALVADGLRGSAARALRARFRGSGVTLTLSGTKSDSWLATHLDNPFRDWADDDPAAGDAACKAYATALKALGTITAPAGLAAEPILRELVRRLNAVDDRFDVIDTIRREEAGDAFLSLAARAGVPSALADEWFDTWRDF
jgi:hypothetical protein